MVLYEGKFFFSPPSPFLSQVRRLQGEREKGGHKNPPAKAPNEEMLPPPPFPLPFPFLLLGASCVTAPVRDFSRPTNRRLEQAQLSSAQLGAGDLGRGDICKLPFPLSLVDSSSSSSKGLWVGVCLVEKYVG